MSTNRKLFHAYTWNMFGKLIVRSISVISTLVLVRLLSPEDFGIMAIAIMVIGFFTVLSDAGVNRYIIMHDNPKKETFDKAFTLNILLRFVAFSILIVFASSIASFIKNPEVESVIIMVGFTSFLSSFVNVGLLDLERKLDYAPVNKILMISKVISTLFTLVIAYVYQSYMALIIGSFVMQLVTICLSYTLHDFRPRLDFKFESAMFTFSSFLLLRNIISYSRSQVDILLVGKKFSEAELGKFSIARQFAIMPQTEIVAPAMQPGFSALSQLKSDSELYLTKIYQILFLVFLFLMPCAFGLYILSESFVYVLLGEKWMSVSNYIGILAFLMIPFFLQTLISIAYDNLGKVKVSFLVDLFGLSLIVLLFYTITIESVQSFALLRLAVGFISLVLSVFLARFFLNFNIIKFCIVFGVPLLFSLCMFALLINLEYFFVNHYIKLFTLSAVGGFFYGICFLITVILAIKLRPNAWVLILLPSKFYQLLETKLRFTIPSQLKNEK